MISTTIIASEFISKQRKWGHSGSHNKESCKSSKRRAWKMGFAPKMEQGYAITKISRLCYLGEDFQMSANARRFPRVAVALGGLHPKSKNDSKDQY